ncbi:MAG: hypothetical protein ABJ061_06405, partial [Marinobacter sp.]|uniref:hypothetical protein n=1 Tax=Marinobacter sp. TaxID=50741 RepID=UPI003296B6C5
GISKRARYQRLDTCGFTKWANAHARGQKTSICIANSPEFWKKPGGPINPQSVKENPRLAQIIDNDSDSLKDASKNIHIKIKNRRRVLTIFTIMK